MFDLKRYTFKVRYNPIIEDRLERAFQDIELITVLQQFTVSPKEFMILCDIDWRTKSIDEARDSLIADMDALIDIKTISSHKRKTLAFVRGIYDPAYTELFLYTTQEFLCFFEFPLEFRKDHGLLNLAGPPEDVTRLVDFMHQWGSEFEVRAIRNYDPADRGVVAVLTDKQRDVLKHAYDRGFFDTPRRKDVRELSGNFGIAHTTYLTHIRKGQRRLLSAIFGE